MDVGGANIFAVPRVCGFVFGVDAVKCAQGVCAAAAAVTVLGDSSNVADQKVGMCGVNSKHVLVSPRASILHARCAITSRKAKRGVYVCVVCVVVFVRS